MHYIIQEDTSSTVDNRDLYPVLCDDGEKPFILKITEDGTRVSTIPLTPDNFKLKNLKPLNIKNIKPQKKTLRHRTLASQSALLNPADIHSDDDNDDIIDTRVPTQAELSHLENTLNTPISHPLNPFTAADKQITQQEYDDISQQTKFELHSLLLQPPPDFYPLTSLFDIDPNKYLDFFIPPSEQLTFDLICTHQKSDFVLMIIRKWLTDNDKPLYKTANITGNKGLNHYYERFEYLSIDSNTDLLYFTYYRENTYNPNPITLICLPIKLLLLAFYQAHHHNLSGHYGLDRTYNNFSSQYYFPSLRKWLRLLIYDCIPCQTQKSSRMDINTATQIPFASTANNFNHRISMDTKGPIFPASKDNHYIFVICDAFSHFVVTQPTPLNDAETATETY